MTPRSSPPTSTTVSPPVRAGLRRRCPPADEAEIDGHSLAHDADTQSRPVRCPVTLVCGAETNSIGPDHLGLLAASLTSVRVEVLPGLGHFGPLQDPDALSRSLRSAAVRADATPGA